MIASEKIVNDLSEELKRRNIKDPALLKIIVAFTIQHMSLTGLKVFSLRKKKNRSEYHEYMDALHASFYNCLNRK